MSITALVFQKLIVLFILMLLGFYLMKKEIFTKDVTYHLSKLLTVYVAPSLFIASFIAQTFSYQRLIDLGLMILVSFIIIFTRIGIIHFLLPKQRTTDKYATIFANVGFMGTPLALAVGGKDAVFFISGFVVANQISQWTYGVYLISNDKSKVNVRSALLNPASIATIIGLTLFVFPFKLPFVVTDAIDTFAQLNTPLSTLVLGTYFYQAKFKDVFLYKPAYYTTFLRLIATSLFSLIIIWLLPIDNHSVKLALTIASISPAALNTALLSQVFRGDYQYGSRLVLLTTLFSLISIPLLMTLVSLLYL